MKIKIEIEIPEPERIQWHELVELVRKVVYQADRDHYEFGAYGGKDRAILSNLCDYMDVVTSLSKALQEKLPQRNPLNIEVEEVSPVD